MTERCFRHEDWPYGLRCADCGFRFFEGQPITTRQVTMPEGYAADIIICLFCAGKISSIRAKLAGE